MSKEETGAKAPEQQEGEESPYINEVRLAGLCDEAPQAIKTEKGWRARFGMTIPHGNSRTFVKVVAWDEAAKRCAQAKQGSLLRIGGRLRSWKGEEKGATTRLEVVVNEVDPIDASAEQEMAAA